MLRLCRTRGRGVHTEDSHGTEDILMTIKSKSEPGRTMAHDTRITDGQPDKQKVNPGTVTEVREGREPGAKMKLAPFLGAG